MIHTITITQFLNADDRVPLMDVRTPAEFVQGHIPGAINLPLFSNEERVKVGTTYKQEGREAAILLGFDLTGNKWSGFIKQALESVPGKKLALHCWRGGMRSEAMAWALSLYGFDISIIKGGYKQYRHWVLNQFEKKYQLSVIGGMTGSGKTKILHELRRTDEQIIDLEELAAHQGSSYGSMNKLVQPTQEQFENDLALQLFQLDSQKIIWVEDESRSIGKRQIPNTLWDQMQAAMVIDIQVPLEERVALLTKEYGELDKDFLIECTMRIRKRLGFDQCKQAVTAIEENRMEDFIRLVLVYYDKTYRRGLGNRISSVVIPLELNNADPVLNAKRLLTIPDPLLQSNLLVNRNDV